jgi:hypothetical protein
VATAAIQAPAWLPNHPALAVLPWETEVTDVHGVAVMASGPDGVMYGCYCGHDTDRYPTVLDACAALISHALKTCAACHGPKPADNFPRCSPCAF